MKLTINKDGEARKMKHAWHLVDWDQPSSWIADQMGVSGQYVVGRRRKYAPETIRKHHFKTVAAEERWKGADWSKGNTALGREMGMNRNSVAKARKRHSPHNARCEAVPTLTPQRHVQRRNAIEAGESPQTTS